MITVSFAHDQKQRNAGFSFNVPVNYWDMFKIYEGQISKKAVASGKKQYLKNWNVKSKDRIQNMGKNAVNTLHGIACGILNKDPKPYTSHTWRRSAATNLADAGVSFLNLKRHGQWISDSVVEGYIANSKPLRDERLHCLMPKELRDKDVGGELQATTKTDEIVETEVEEFVDLTNPPQVMKEIEESGLTLIGLSQVYDPDLALLEPEPIVNAGTIAMAPTNDRLSARAENGTSMEQFFDAMKASGNTFMNCTFNFS